MLWLVRRPTSRVSLCGEITRSPLPHLHSIALDGFRRIKGDARHRLRTGSAIVPSPEGFVTDRAGSNLEFSEESTILDIYRCGFSAACCAPGCAGRGVVTARKSKISKETSAHPLASWPHSANIRHQPLWLRRQSDNGTREFGKHQEERAGEHQVGMNAT
jgi:hypothetical protein